MLRNDTTYYMYLISWGKQLVIQTAVAYAAGKIFGF